MEDNKFFLLVSPAIPLAFFLYVLLVFITDRGFPEHTDIYQFIIIFLMFAGMFWRNWVDIRSYAARKRIIIFVIAEFFLVIFIIWFIDDLSYLTTYRHQCCMPLYAEARHWTRSEWIEFFIDSIWFNAERGLFFGASLGFVSGMVNRLAVRLRLRRRGKDAPVY